MASERGKIYPGRPRVGGVSSHVRRPLHDGWTYCSFAPGVATDPGQLEGPGVQWSAAVVPGTVASALRDDGEFDLERAAEIPDFDAVDWWFRCHFDVEDAGADVHTLCFDGLATLADVWLNGKRILASDDMFVRHEVDVSSILSPRNELVIRFRSLRVALESRRPRPRWRTRLVEHQQLRWHRTTLLGRIPGWTPPVRTVGPWRPIRLERRRAVEIVAGDVNPSVPATGKGGVVDAALSLRPIAGTTIRAAVLHVGDRHASLTLSDAAGTDVAVAGTLALPDAAHWWPHTHGDQPRYDARLVVETNAGDVEIDLGAIGFRSVAVETSDDGFAVAVNGVPVFCRGACWSTPDIVSLGGAEATYRSLLTLARDAGMNMIRVGGTMVYEADCFYDICDELGIMVWQDFMFANMDYPAADAQFAAAVAREADDVLARLRRHPALAVLCGNSEIEQQAAMLGLERELWTNSIFTEILPDRCAAGIPGVPYWPSSPSGGALPFHVDSGVSHFYGVGAYLRPLEDARRSRVRFTSECLGISNVPEPAVVETLLPNGEAPFHHPRWKARVPRDAGAGWDFEDVRDHYLGLLFGVDPMRLRYAEMDRYLALSRVVSGELMARTIGEWRRAGSTCRGALVWFYQDLWLGAGWGIVDATGRPKAAYYALKRAMQPVGTAITDEGANGLHVHVVNDRAEPLDARLSLRLLRGGTTIVAESSVDLTVPGRGATITVADRLLGRFFDTAYSYRFGPPGHDVAVATVRDRDGHVLSEAFHFPAGVPSDRVDGTVLSGRATRLTDDVLAITIRAERFAQSVALDCGEFVPDDNYFHMSPGAERTVFARARASGARFAGFAQALNAREGIRLAMATNATPAAPPQAGATRDGPAGAADPGARPGARIGGSA